MADVAQLCLVPYTQLSPAGLIATFSLIDEREPIVNCCTMLNVLITEI